MSNAKVTGSPALSASPCGLQGSAAGDNEADFQRADESAEFWQRHAHELQLALWDEDHATHRCVGINKAGEMMVVRTDGH
jgi:hypothetical protein